MTSPILPDLIDIPGGRLQVGVPSCPPNANFAWTWHTGQYADIAKFQLARHQVTNAEYRAFLTDTGYSAPSHIYRAAFNEDQQPVVGISWTDAVTYCRWLSRLTDRVYRLPTDAEWEYSARGGRENTIFPWGDALDPQLACFGGRAAPQSVGSYPPNGFGLYEMIGNAWEWCSDRFEDVSAGLKAVNNPTGQATEDNRVLRGGSYMTTHYLNLWIAYRHEDPPDLRHESIGFRVAA
jgi:formylglycine-generating enzyme required for sulfatase activity